MHSSYALALSISDWTDMQLSDRYRELFLRVTRRKPDSARSIAERASLHKSTLSHFVRRGGHMKYDHQVALLNAAGIDRLRSFIAIEILDDPDSYDDPAVEMVSGIIPPLLEFMTSREVDLIDPLRDNEREYISEYIADYLVVISKKRSERQRSLFEMRNK